MGDGVWSGLPFAGKTRPMVPEHRPGEQGEPSAVRPLKRSMQIILDKTWGPQLAVTGMDGYPLPANAGNVLLPYSTAKLCLRLPPTLDAEKARAALKAALEKDPPYDADVVFDVPRGDNGWNAPPLAPWLEASLNKASLAASASPWPTRAKAAPFLSWPCWAKLPQDPVRGHRRFGTALQRAWPQRISAHRLRQEIVGGIAQVMADHGAASEMSGVRTPDPGRPRVLKLLSDRKPSRRRAGVAWHRPTARARIALLADRAGMDPYLHPDGCGRLAGLEKTSWRTWRHDPLCRTAGPEPVLAPLAWPEPGAWP